jgi:hypothetical protein
MKDRAMKRHNMDQIKKVEKKHTLQKRFKKRYEIMSLITLTDCVSHTKHLCIKVFLDIRIFIDLRNAGIPNPLSPFTLASAAKKQIPQKKTNALKKTNIKGTDSKIQRMHLYGTRGTKRMQEGTIRRCLHIL